MSGSRAEAQIKSLLNESIDSAKERERSTFDAITAPFQRRLVLFGAGNLGRAVLQILRQDGIEPLAFADNAGNLWGNEVHGVKVLSPADAAQQFGESATFVVTAFRPGLDFLSIRQQLRSLSCARVVSFASLFWKHPECMPYLLLDLPHHLLLQKEKVWQAFAVLGDEMSRNEYVGQIRWRLFQDFDALPPPARQEQYFPDDLFSLDREEVFIDCGAYDGDTVRAVISHRPDFKHILSLEPDPGNFERLRQSLLGMPDPVRGKISARNIGVGATNGMLRFDAVGGLGSKFSGRGESEVASVRLDDLLDGCRPTYVKMDIEGAEMGALSGAHKTLGLDSVIWAVCVYHKPEDLWEIPLYIDAHSQGHRFFLRKYLREVWESVLYAVPAERVRTSAPHGSDD